MTGSELTLTGSELTLTGSELTLTGSELTLTGREGDMYMHSIVLHALESRLLECLSLKTTRRVLKLLGIAKAKKPFKYS